MSVAAWCAAGCSRGAPASRTAQVSGSARADSPHARCAWIAAEEDGGVQVFVDRAAFFDAIHPKWYRIAAGGAIERLPAAGDPRVLDAARAHGVAVMPLVAAIGAAGGEAVRPVLRDPARRAAHVAALVDLATTHGYAGLDVDYEGLWGAGDRAAVAAFIDELARAMRDAGKQLTAAVPAEAEARAGSPWNYGFLAERLDRIHIMGYDLHPAGGHAGPVAPLGWIEAVVARAAATGRADRFILGLPAYGVAGEWTATSRRSADLCGASYDVADLHMAVCPRGTWAAGRAPHCRTERGTLYFEDLASLEEKVIAARRAGLGGVTWWRLGGEPDGFFEMVESHVSAGSAGPSAGWPRDP